MPDPRDRGEINGTDGAITFANALPQPERTTERRNKLTHPDTTHEPRRGD